MTHIEMPIITKPLRQVVQDIEIYEMERWIDGKERRSDGETKRQRDGETEGRETERQRGDTHVNPYTLN
jgi:hypothetical protein